MTIQTGKNIVKAAETGNFKALTIAYTPLDWRERSVRKALSLFLRQMMMLLRKYHQKTLIDLLGYKEKTTKVLSHHIAHTKIMSEGIKNLKAIKTIDGDELSVHPHVLGMA